MSRGIELQLFSSGGTTPLANQTFKMLWFDTDDDFTDRIPKSTFGYPVTTDSSGWLRLNLESISGLDVGGVGFMVIYAKNASTYQNSLVFASKMTITNVTGGTNPYTTIPITFVRNIDWPAQLTVTAGVQKFQGLLAVYDHDSNFIAIQASGNYTVDWGDGTTPDNTTAATQTNHQYTYANVPGTIVGTSKSVAVTFMDIGDTVNYTAHPYQNGQILNFATITTTTGISTNTKYYVVNRTTNTFQVATTLGGTALALTGNGSGTVFIPEYKVAVVTLTPQSGQNLTSLTLQVLHPTFSVLSQPQYSWLEVAANSIWLSSLVIGKFSNIIYTADLTVVTYGENIQTDFSYMFNYCTALQNIPLLNTALGINFLGMFERCIALQGIPLLNTSAGTNFASMFYGCITLQSIPLLDTSAGTMFNNMFGKCFSLKYIPSLNTIVGTSFTNVFSSCNMLQGIPLLNTAVGIDFNSMFMFCSSLQSIPLLNTASGTNFSAMFYGCNALQSISLLNTASGTNFNYMFYGCNALRRIPLLNTAAGTNFTNMFGGCSIIETIPLLNTAAGTNFTGMFGDCTSLRSIPLLNTAMGTNFYYMFGSCSIIETIPLLNTAAGTNFSSMFYACELIKTIPLLDTSAATDLSYMFNYCTALQSIPLLNTATNLDYTSIFDYDVSLSVGSLLGVTRSISYSGCRLSATELNNIYTNLGTAFGAQTITVTGNYGVTGDDPTIATAKGWTVVG